VIGNAGSWTDVFIDDDDEERQPIERGRTMLSKHSVGVLLALCVCALVFTGCDDDDWYDFWGDWDLEGRWTISEVSHEGTVIFSYRVYIDQHGNQVDIERGDEVLSEGFISDDRIYCEDWYHYDVERIYIDSERHMHSERADHPQVDYLEFDRVN
jgi:hypothetical protein